MVRASASVAVDSGLIPSQVTPRTLKLVFTASLLGAQQQRINSVKNSAGKFACCAVGKSTERDSPSW